VTPVLVDAGFLIALYDKREPMHQRCLQVYDSTKSPLVTCEAVVGEALHLLRRLPLAVRDLLSSVDQGILEIPFSLPRCAATVATIMEKYLDTPADFADACLIHLADQVGTGDILTLDSDFRHYRWRRTRRFHMLIPLD
jgi:predicted nucleic acid-binding protein